MKNLKLIKVVAFLSLIVLSLVVILSQKHRTAYGNTLSSEVTVIVSDLHVREDANNSSKIICLVHQGNTFQIIKTKNSWDEIKLSRNQTGWVYNAYVTATTHTNVPSIAQNSQEPLKGKTFVLDPGHGGIDDGTTSIVGTHEKALTLPTAEIVKQKLENAGANVIMTRTNDTYIPLLKRAELSNQNHADAFISFHYNWSGDPSVNGITDFYYRQSGNPLASDIINEAVKTTGLKNDGTRFDDLSVLRNNSQPSTLIELGFLSNKHDDSIVENSAYRQKVAQGVYLGLLDYFQSKNN